MRILWVIISILFFVALGLLIFGWKAPRQKIDTSKTSTAMMASPAKSPESDARLKKPIEGFDSRITKKPFGIFVTPQNSPVNPERFTGFHTAVDVEFEDGAEDVPVYAVADGQIVLSQTASGYGGVFMLKFAVDGVSHNAVYGHIRPSSLPEKGRYVKQGEQMGILGAGFSAETDGERRHLHFGILSNDRIDLRGYVQSKNELSGWVNPLNFKYLE